MKPLLTAKLLVDVLMTGLYIALMGFGPMESDFHEVLGLTLFAMFLLHHLLNLKWYRSLTKGKWTAARKLQVGLNILLLAVMVGMAISSVMVSRRIFPFEGGLPARKLHACMTNWGLLLISAHIGFHWEMMLRMVRKLTNWDPSRNASIALRCLAALIAAYGVYAFFVHEVGTKFVMYYGYSYWDFESKAVLFYVDYLALMGLFIYMAHCGMKMVKTKTRGIK